MKTLAVSLKIFFFFIVLTGIVYPLFITGIAQVAFARKANGSLLIRDNKPVGSELIGQEFDSSIYFMSRPSAASYNPLPSGGSNFGLTNRKLKDLFTSRKTHFATVNHLAPGTNVPAEMLFASASGLDPHIPVQAALLQADRVAEARQFTPAQKERLLQCIRDLTEPPQFFILGNEHINVLMLNLETDRIK